MTNFITKKFKAIYDCVTFNTVTFYSLRITAMKRLRFILLLFHFNTLRGPISHARKMAGTCTV